MEEGSAHRPGTRYWQRCRVPGLFPVVGVLALAKAGETRLRPMGPGAAAARLLRAAPFVNGDPAAAPVLTGRCAAVAGDVPWGELGFTLDGGVVRALSDLAGMGDASEACE